MCASLSLNFCCDSSSLGSGYSKCSLDQSYQYQLGDTQCRHSIRIFSFTRSPGGFNVCWSLRSSALEKFFTYVERHLRAASHYLLASSHPTRTPSLLLTIYKISPQMRILACHALFLLMYKWFPVNRFMCWVPVTQLWYSRLSKAAPLYL